MDSARTKFLAQVSDAVATGNTAGKQVPLPRGRRWAYQGGGPDPLAQFQQALASVGGIAHVASSSSEAIQRMRHIIRAVKARRIVLGRGGLIEELNLPIALKGVGSIWQEPRETSTNSEDRSHDEANKQALFAADVGITNADALIAETGTLVLWSRPGQARSLSLLPPVHIVIAAEGQLLPDLYDLFDQQQLPGRGTDADELLPACVTLITGPSKTGDIELKLVTGVHGPGEVHVVVLKQ